MKPRLITLGVFTLLCVNQSVLAGAGCVVAKKPGGLTGDRMGGGRR